MRAFALTVPGLGPILADEARRAGLDPGPVEHDGRADVVPIAHASHDALAGLRTAESTFVELGHPRIERTARATAAAIGQRAVHVVVRLQTERGFTRTALRDALRGRGRDELWVVQTSASRVRVGVRTHRSARANERPGALRPAVAAAMVIASGRVPGRLLDPCCGSGTIVAAARTAGWRAVAGDIDAVGPIRLDARALPFLADGFDAVATNLPFGGHYRVQGTPVAWYRRVLAEAVRVAPVAVVLAPPSTPFRQALGRLRVDLVDRHDLVLLGRPTTMWVLRRRGGPAR